MSPSSRLRSLATALAFTIGMGAAIQARAEKVDWSDYIEPAGSKRPLPHPSTATPQIAKPTADKPDKKAASKTSKTTKKTQASKGKTAKTKKKK